MKFKPITIKLNKLKKNVTKKKTKTHTRTHRHTHNDTFTQTQLIQVEVAKRTSLNGSTRLGSLFNSLNTGTPRDEL